MSALQSGMDRLKVAQPVLNANKALHWLGSSPRSKTSPQQEFNLHAQSAVYGIHPHMV
jgi:hypothetical protein